MIDEPFATGSSFLHKADPRAKLTAAVALSCILAVSPSPVGPALGLLAGAVCLVWAGLPAHAGRSLLRRLAAVNGFVAFLWVFLPFSTPGETAAVFGPLTATRQGLALAVLVTLKTNAIMCLFLALIATSDAASLGQAMHRLRVPPKLVFLFLFTYRFIHVIGDEQRRLFTAAKLRGFTPRTSLHTYKTLASLLAMVLVGAMRRAEMTRRSMLLRCFHGSFGTLRSFRLGLGEYALLTAAAIFAICLSALEVLHV
ncbi:MAG: cobalt ECF transporter T component CbiQ [Desulfovibrionaceae bacterium CG1_02_65_16]|nr:MAG: cobalt ECF transporter T component CbiQ [Desulfovibrionaceae bacterium CG1_02_65_16]